MTMPLSRSLWLVYVILFLCDVWSRGMCWCQNKTYENRKYTFCSDDYTKAAAEMKCQDLNMRLAIVTTYDELSYWKSYLLLNTIILGEVWVGATFSQTLNQFVWDEGNITVPHTFIDSDGNPDYTGIPNGACLRFSRLVKLRWEQCDNAYTGYFCQEIFPLVKVTTALGTNLTDTTTEPSSATETTGLTTEHTPAATSLKTELTTLNTELTSVKSTSLETDTSINTSEIRSTNTTIKQDSTDTTTSLTTSFSTNTGFPEKNQLVCFCSCSSPPIPSDQDELEVFKQESKEKIEKQLGVDTTTLSSTVRRKTSANDKRPSAQSVGYLGVTLMVISFFFIFALDITKVGLCEQCLGSCGKKTKLT